MLVLAEREHERIRTDALPYVGQENWRRLDPRCGMNGIRDHAALDDLVREAELPVELEGARGVPDGAGFLWAGPSLSSMMCTGMPRRPG